MIKAEVEKKLRDVEAELVQYREIGKAEEIKIQRSKTHDELSLYRALGEIHEIKQYVRRCLKLEQTLESIHTLSV